MIVVVPTVIPEATPEEEPMVATAGVLLLQIPPVVASVSVITVPVHWLTGPPMAATAGTGLMVITLLEVPVPQIPVAV